LPFTRRLAVQTIRGHGFANGNFQCRLAEVLGRPHSPRVCHRIALGAREPRGQTLPGDGLLEQAAQCDSVERGRLQAKSNNGAGELIHHDQDPMRSQRDGFNLKHIHAPQAIFGPTQQDEPRWTTTADFGAVIDPATGAMKGALAAGSEPDRISLSTDSGYLHVALNGAMGVQRFNRLANSADISFGFPTNDIYYAQDLLVQPGNASTVAASLSSYNMAAGFPSTVLAYDGGVARPNSGGPARGLASSSDGSTLFGCVSPGSSSAFERMVLNASGFTTTSVPGFTAVPNSLLFNSGRLYSSAGQVADASTGTLLGSMSVSGPEAVDGAAGRAFFLVQSGTNWQIRAFDLSTFQLTGTQTVFGVRGTPLNLIRCGQDRLAFSTRAGQTIIAHSILTMTNVMTSPSPPFQLLSSPGMFTNPPSLQIDTQPGSWYTVYTSSNLANWNVLTNFYASLPNIQIADPATDRFSARFYRVSSP
jgi:hypothetical protein